MPPLLHNFIISVVVCFGLWGAINVAFRTSNLPWWPTVLFQCIHRPKIAGKWVVNTLLLSILACGTFSVPAGSQLGFLLWIVFAPGFIANRINAAAFRDDCNEPPGKIPFDAALKYRNNIRKRAGIIVDLDGNKPWREYTTDIERAKISAKYTPPGAESFVVSGVPLL